MTHPIEELARRIYGWHGDPVLVGGAVRDWVISGMSASILETSADYDIECFGITLPKLKDMLDYNDYSFDEVGEHFSVLKVRVPGIEEPVDLSIPRWETSTGDGHKEFQVMVNPELTFKEASRRRDLRINAMGYDMITGELLDPYDGQFDILTQTLLHVSDAFAEDPLRPLRVARFAARFDYDVDMDTVVLCQEMRPLADALPSERIWTEIEKAVHECQRLGGFFGWLYAFGWLDLFPEINALVSVEQDPEWHPEGNVLIHTIHALDYWSQNLRTGNKEDDLITAIAILCHDFCKVTHTQYDQKP